jgi:hypothetical protein
LSIAAIAAASGSPTSGRKISLIAMCALLLTIMVGIPAQLLLIFIKTGSWMFRLMPLIEVKGSSA